MNNDIKIFGGVIGATLLLIIGAVFLFNRGGDTNTSGGSSFKPQIVDAKVLVHDDSWFVGTASAKVTVVEFGDYQCPACKSTEPGTEELIKNYKDKIRFVWREFPLTQIHEFGFASAEAAEAAGIQGKFWEMHDRLFAISPDLGKDKLIAAAKDVGLDVNKFTKDMDSDAVRQRVLNDQADGNKAGVDSTPTYFINGEKLQLDHLPSYSDFQAKIDPLLSK